MWMGCKWRDQSWEMMFCVIWLRCNSHCYIQHHLCGLYYWRCLRELAVWFWFKPSPLKNSWRRVCLWCVFFFFICNLYTMSMQDMIIFHVYGKKKVMSIVSWCSDLCNIHKFFVYAIFLLLTIKHIFEMLLIIMEPKMNGVSRLRK